MKRTLALTAALFLIANSYGQKPAYIYEGYVGSDDQLDPKKLHKWAAQKLSDYNGVYHFGESEGETDLLVIAHDSSLVLQSFANDWGKVDNRKVETWRKSVKVLRGVKIMNNAFVSDSMNGFFMVYDLEKGKMSGIIVPDNPGKIDTVEFGGRERLDVEKFWFFKGEYPELSYKMPDTSYFKSRSKEQLQVMRNEIYARYGQRFAKGGKMYAYFSTKKWYEPFRDNVQMCLTDIELRNITLIKYFESGD
jgi:YARHG domain